MAFKHRSFSLHIGTSRFGATKIPPSRPLPEPLRDPGLARNVFSLMFFSDPGDFCVKNHVLHQLRSHCVTQALLRRCSEGENRCFHQTISLILRDTFMIFLRSLSRIFSCPPFLTTGAFPLVNINGTFLQLHGTCLGSGYLRYAIL